MNVMNFFTMQNNPENEKYIAKKKFSKAIETTFLDFLGDPYFGIQKIYFYPLFKKREEIVNTALRAARHNYEFGAYDFIYNNCEHFAFYCATDYKFSLQK